MLFSESCDLDLYVEVSDKNVFIVSTLNSTLCYGVITFVPRVAEKGHFSGYPNVTATS